MCAWFCPIFPLTNVFLLFCFGLLFHSISMSQAALCVTIADRIGITDGVATTAAELVPPNPDRMFCLLTRLMVIDQGMAVNACCLRAL